MTHTLLVAFAIVGSIAALVAMLIFITRRQMRAKKKALWSAYNALLSQHSITTDIMEEFPHRILGLDSTQKVFVAVQQDDTCPGIVIRLRDVSGYGVTKSGRTTINASRGGKNHSEEHINAISLLFLLQDGGKMEFPLYSEILDGIEERTKLHGAADEWHKRLEAALHRQKPALLKPA